MLAEGAWEIMDSGAPTITAQVNSQHKKEIIHNTSIYIEVIRNLRWLVTQGLAIRGKWLSHDIENELIGIMGEIVMTKIVEKVKKCNFYGIMTDETTDNYNIEQACLTIRYVDPKTYDIYEDFVDISAVHSTTGAALFENLVLALNRLSLRIEDCRGQGYDGAAAMSSIKVGLRARVQSVVGTAVYTHCFAHRLNLCLKDGIAKMFERWNREDPSRQDQK